MGILSIGRLDSLEGVVCNGAFDEQGDNSRQHYPELKDCRYRRE